MKKCDYCQHVEMCGWREDAKGQGCELFDDGNKWTPVSERLPEDEQVLLQYETPKGSTNFVVSWVDIWGRWQNIDGNFIPIAWIPLPKPYKHRKGAIRNDQRDSTVLYESI